MSGEADFDTARHIPTEHVSNYRGSLGKSSRDVRYLAPYLPFVPAYKLPFATFGDLAAFDLEASLSCRCGRHTVLDTASGGLRDRPIGHSRFRCTTHLPSGIACGQLHGVALHKRDRAGWSLAEHWRAMMDRNPDARDPGRIRSFRDRVHAGQIAWLSDMGCHPGGYTMHLVAFDEPPFDRWLDRPVGPIVCPTCRKRLRIQTVHGNSTRGGMPAQPPRRATVAIP